MESEGSGPGWIQACRVNTVLFDFDGTLVFHKPDSFEVVSSFCDGIGQPLDADAERRGRRIRHRYFVDPNIRQQLDGMPRDQFWHHLNRHLLTALGIQGDLDQLADEITVRVQSLELVHDCPEPGCQTLSVLRSRGYRLGLVSNRDDVERFYTLLDVLGLRQRFDMTLASGEIGIRKPEAGIFDAALTRVGAQAGESIYVGDNYWADVLGAEKAGITPVLFDPHGLFPEARCLVLKHIDELLSWLP